MKLGGRKRLCGRIQGNIDRVTLAAMLAPRWDLSSLLIRVCGQMLTNKGGADVGGSVCCCACVCGRV